MPKLTADEAKRAHLDAARLMSVAMEETSTPIPEVTAALNTAATVRFACDPDFREQVTMLGDVILEAEMHLAEKGVGMEAWKLMIGLAAGALLPVFAEPLPHHRDYNPDVAGTLIDPDATGQ